MFLLFERFPELAARARRVPLGRFPTPVHRLERLSRRLGVEVWVKREDRTADGCGGNKVRGLEFLLGAPGPATLLVPAVSGSHHARAASVHGAAQGFRVVPVLFDAARPAHALAVPFRLLAARLRNGPGRVLPPGGSSALAALGHVNAMLELAAQVERGDAPRPRAVFVASGTGGTAGGLWAGLGLLGWDVALHAIAVSAWPFDSAARVRRMAEEALRMLGRPPTRGAGASLLVTRRFRGPGYGRPTPEAEDALALASEDGLALELTYTAKALAALVAAARAVAPGPLLFWHTAPAPGS